MVTPEEVKAKTPERFWSNIKFGEPEECWEWYGVRFPMGYGRYIIVINGQKFVKATRYLYYCLHGDFNFSLCILHAENCNNPSCCNPNHLRLGTQKENMEQAFRQKRVGKLIGSQKSNSKLNEVQAAEIKAKLFDGIPQYKIASEYGVSQRAINQINIGRTWIHVEGEVNRNGRRTKRNNARGSKAYNAKLKEEDVVVIKRYLSEGRTHREISEMFCVNQGVVGRIALNRIWKHVNVPSYVKHFRRGNQKLREDQVVEIKKRILAGEKVKNIAKEYPVSIDTIKLIRQGKIWNKIIA